MQRVFSVYIIIQFIIICQAIIKILGHNALVIILLNSVFIPNTFTPNDDGLNDVFNVVTLPQCIQKFSLSIFNVWGQKVFSTDKLEEGWNGVYKGQQAEDDVYSYILEYTMDSGKSYRRTGHVILIK